MIDGSHKLTSETCTFNVVAIFAGSVHPQCNAIEQYYKHTRSLEPCAQELRKIVLFSLHEIKLLKQVKFKHNLIKTAIVR